MMRLKPSEIMFSQETVNNYFDKRSLHSGRLIGETLDDICEGRCSIHDIPTIRVMERDGKWVTADNRRLWVFRELERLGKCDEIPVRETYYIHPEKLNSVNGGVSVRVRRHAGGHWHNKPSVRRPEPRKSSASTAKLDRKIHDCTRSYAKISASTIPGTVTTKPYTPVTMSSAYGNTQNYTRNAHSDTNTYHVNINIPKEPSVSASTGSRSSSSTEKIFRKNLTSSNPGLGFNSTTRQYSQTKEPDRIFDVHSSATNTRQSALSAYGRDNINREMQTEHNIDEKLKPAITRSPRNDAVYPSFGRDDRLSARDSGIVNNTRRERPEFHTINFHEDYAQTRHVSQCPCTIL